MQRQNVRYPFFLMLVLSILLIPVHSIAASGEKLVVDGYHFNISADQTGERLSVRGWVSRGERCRKLVAKIYLHTDEGDAEQVRVVIDNYGGNARFNVKEETSRTRARWRVLDVTVSTY